MVKPKEKIAPSGPRQTRPERDSSGAWLPPTVPFPGTRELPIPTTARPDAQQRHRSAANQLSVDALVRWPRLPRDAASPPVAKPAPRVLEQNRVGSRATKRVCEHARQLHSLASPDPQRLEYGHCLRVITGLEHRLLRGATMGRYRIRCASSLGVLFLSKCPINVFVLKSLLEFRGAVAEEFQKGNTNCLRFIVEPSRLYQSRQFLGDLVRQIDIYGFHSNSILGDRSVCVHPFRVSPAAGSVKAPQGILRGSVPSGDPSARTDPMVTLRHE